MRLIVFSDGAQTALHDRARVCLIVRAMNVHHLELFYYVAKHGGISAAVRAIPYGIQQPAVSGQMGKLEEDVGVKLFARNPFRLTEAGERLYAHVQPFFENLETVAEQLREGAEPGLRIGASELMLRNHIPAVMRRLRAKHPRVRLGLETGTQAQLESGLLDGRLDLAICPVDGRAPARLRRVPLARVPLILLVAKRSPYKTAKDFWALRKVTEPLVGLPAATSLMRGFQRELKRRGVIWPQLVEAPSIELVKSYVANGDGVGVSLAEPAVSKDRQVRVLPLDGFEPLVMGVLLRAEPSSLASALTEEIRIYAGEVWPEWTLAETDR